MPGGEGSFLFSDLQHVRDNHNIGCSVDQVRANYSLWAKFGCHLLL